MSEEIIEQTEVMENEQTEGKEPQESEETGEDREEDQEQGETGEVEETEKPDGYKEEPTERSAKLYKVKIDGEEKEVTEDELIKNYQLEQASRKKMEEAAMTTKQINSLIEQMKDPKGFVELATKMGHDPEKWAEDIIVKKIEQEMMTEEERTIEKLRKSNEENEKRLKEIEEKESTAKQQAQQEHYRNEYEKKLLNIVDKAGLSETKDTNLRNLVVNLAINEMQSAIQANAKIEPSDIDDGVIVEKIGNYLDSLFKYKATTLKEDDIEKYKDIVDNISRLATKKLKTPTGFPNVTESGNSVKKVNVKQAKMNINDYFEKLKSGEL